MLQDAITITEFESKVTRLCHSDINIYSVPSQRLTEKQNYVAAIHTNDQFMPPVKSQESLTLVSANAIDMDKFGSKLSTLYHLKHDINSANLGLPLRHSIDFSENQLDTQNVVDILQPPLDSTTFFSVFPTFFGPESAFTPISSTILGYFHRRDVTIFKHYDQRH